VVTLPFLDQSAAAAPARPDVRAYVHADLPATPRSALRSHPRVLLGFLLVFLALAVSASVAGSQLLLTWDQPIQRWVEAHRTAALDDVFRGFSRLGATVPVMVVGLAVGLAAWRRCQAVGVAVLAATFSKPLIETVLKAIVDRERPDFERLVAGNGPSFPSGHAMAAMALWGMVPLVVSLYTRRRAVWWASVTIAAAVVGGIAASRVYLGVHWFSDVVGGLMAGAIFLLAVQALYDRVHATRGCRLTGAGPTRGRRYVGPDVRPDDLGTIGVEAPDDLETIGVEPLAGNVGAERDRSAQAGVPSGRDASR
jgi:undecaprenyl-diphosphatase